MHDAGYPVKSRFFCLTYVAVSFECYYVAFSFDDSVDEDVASDVAYKGYCASADVAVSPWAEGDLIPHMEQERVHAVALCSQRYGLAFSNEFADFFEHLFLVYGNLL